MQTQTQPQPETPTSGAPKLRPKSGRTPLQPKNSPADPSKPKLKPKPIHPCLEITSVAESGTNENRAIADAATPPPPPPLPLPEPSLAEELSAIKKKLERLRLEKEKTEKELNQKNTVLDAMMKALQQRGEIQKNLEIEVDRLYRLKELKSRCMRVCPMRTLREKEQGKIVNEAPSQSECVVEKVKIEETVPSECDSNAEECEVQSPGSACSHTDTH